MLVAPYYAQQRGSTATVDCLCCWGRGCDPGMEGLCCPASAAITAVMVPLTSTLNTGTCKSVFEP